MHELVPRSRTDKIKDAPDRAVLRPNLIDPLPETELSLIGFRADGRPINRLVDGQSDVTILCHCQSDPLGVGAGVDSRQELWTGSPKK